MLSVLAAKSGRSTQNTLCDSGSLSGIPFMVTFIRVMSVPRIRKAVYPMPLPASEVETDEMLFPSNTGRSCPKLREVISFLSIFWYATGVLFPARVERTITSSSRITEGFNAITRLLFPDKLITVVSFLNPR